MSEQTKTPETKPLSKALKWFYGVGDCGFTLMTNVETYYFNSFLTNVAKFSPAVAGVIATITSTVDACLSWIYGAILNSVKPQKWGRYRSWLIMAPWIVPFLYALQFLNIGNGTAAAVIITLGFITSHICWNIPYVANVSMIAVAGKTPDDRAQLASTRGAWANLSKVLFSYVFPVVSTLVASVIGEQHKYMGTAFLLGCVMVALYFAHFKMFEGYETVDVEAMKAAQAKKAADRTSPVDLIRALLQNPPLMALIVADIAKFMFNFVCAGAAIYYFTYVAGDASLNATYILITNILGVVAAYASKSIAKKLSTRTTCIVMFFAMAAALIVANVMYTNVTLVIILMAVAMVGYGVTYSLTPALYADTIVYAEWKSGKNATGWISGLQNVPLKVSIMCRGIVINACLAAAAFNADALEGLSVDQIPVELKKGICVAFMTVPAVALVIAGVVLLVGFRLSKEQVVKYQAEIAARKAQ